MNARLSHLSRLKSKLRNTRHHFRSANWKRLHEYEHMRTGRKNLPLWTFLRHSWCYGADFEDNYELDFLSKTPEEIRTYITRSLFFEFCEQVNDVNEIPVTRDKQRFAEHFKDVLGRKVWTWAEILALPDTEAAPQRLVVKQRWGGKGDAVYFLEPGLQQWAELRDLLEIKFSPPTDYVYEEHIVQHPDLAQLNPESVNCVRVYTFVESNLAVSIWGMHLRVGNGLKMDSVSQGGIALALDEKGRTRAPAMTKNPFTKVTSIHPLSQQTLVGVQIPHFEAMKKMVCQSALLLPKVRVIGWDVAIKPEGPCLIEGNDRGRHTIFQRERDRGCRDLLKSNFEDNIYSYSADS